MFFYLVAFASVVVMILYGRRIPAIIYDKLILNMTEVWYRAVLTRINPESTVLDIGIGTAGALLRCKDLLTSKNITVVGIDYNKFYVEAARASIAKENLERYVRVEFMSVYELASGNPFPIQKGDTATTTTTTTATLFDAAYFSGSISLLPDPAAALRAASSVLKKPDGLVYVTQTYQIKRLPFLHITKPLLKFVTSVDFGQLIMEHEVEEKLWQDSGLSVLEHDVIPNSVNNGLQAAYLSILGQHDNHGSGDTTLEQTSSTTTTFIDKKRK